MIPKPKEKIVTIDGLNRTRRIMSFDLPLARFVLKNKNSSVLYSRKGITKDFYTRDSKLYFTQKELGRLRRGENISLLTRKIDSVNPRLYRRNQYPDAFLIYISKNHDPIYDHIEERYSSLRNYMIDYFGRSVQDVSAVRMWNLSIVSSLIFGMFLMTMIYRYLGQGAAAETDGLAPTTPTAQVLGEDTKKNIAGTDDIYVEQLAEQIIAEHVKISDEEKKQSDYEKKLAKMVKGYPIEKMIPYIAKKDKIVAAFLIGIAKKESGWGEHVPVSDGKDCYNYWGFRAKRDKMGTGGHTCFDSPKDAVDSVSKRIENLVSEEKIKTPEDMVVVWKCGYNCSWDNQKDVRKWVSDVDQYFSDVTDIKK